MATHPLPVAHLAACWVWKALPGGKFKVYQEA